VRGLTQKFGEAEFEVRVASSGQVVTAIGITRICPPRLFKAPAAHAARFAFAGGSTTGSCSATRSTFRGVHRITQSVCVGLVNRATYSLSEMPRTASSRLLSVRLESPGGDNASFQNSHYRRRPERSPDFGRTTHGGRLFYGARAERLLSAAQWRGVGNLRSATTSSENGRRPKTRCYQRAIKRDQGAYGASPRFETIPSSFSPHACS